MDIIKLYRDFRIDFRASGHKHCRTGWVQTKCPFCTGNPGFHLGFCIDPSSQFYNRFVCWRCGGKGIFDALTRLTGASKSEIKKAIGEYGGTDLTPHMRAPLVQIGNKKLKWPSPINPVIPKKHIKYLEKRRFDPRKLIKEYSIKSTSMGAMLDKLDFSWRILIPIFSPEGKWCSFQGRDITGNGLKYLTCPMEREAVHHKHIFYGMNRLKNNDIVIVTEGVTDVWRLGVPSICGFGIKLTINQIKLLSQFERVILLYDPDPQAIVEERKILKRLEMAGTEVVRPGIGDTDPGDMAQEEADSLMLELTRRYW